MAKKRRNCDRVNPLTRIKRDLYGFIDFLAINPQETLAIQATSRSNMSARRSKILGEKRENSRDWLSCPGRRLEVWGWGWDEKRKSWSLRTVEITLEDFDVGAN
jgi:hypothetical protein